VKHDADESQRVVSLLCSEATLVSHLPSFLMSRKITRRQFIATTSLATGFALAAQPVTANVITTDTKGLIAGSVKIPVPDGKIPAYRAMP